ncbi:MAG TPA: GNAT family N-acetyltransferase [Jatrophihabitans sp.]
MTFEITQMTEPDIGDVARCHVACRIEAYSDIVPADDLALRLDVPMVTDSWAARNADATTPVWIARDDQGDVVGFSHSGPPRTEFPKLPQLELYLLYVREATYGSGLSTELLLSAIGAKPAWLWTYKVNARAQRFYGKHGFTRTSAEKLSSGSAAVTEVQMVRV